MAGFTYYERTHRTNGKMQARPKGSRGRRERPSHAGPAACYDAPRTMPFEFRINREDAILEVVYPANPTALDIGGFATGVRKAIEEFSGPWSSLVDQRQLTFMPPDLLKAVTELNGYAERKQMKRHARVVVNAVASLQAWRMSKDGHLQVPVRTFQDRDEALAWLRAEAQADAAQSAACPAPTPRPPR